jgi:hypothetical protein
LFNLKEFHREQNYQGGGGKKKRGKEKKEGIDNDGTIKSKLRACCGHGNPESPHRIGTEGRTQKRQSGVQISFLNT